MRRFLERLRRRLPRVAPTATGFGVRLGVSLLLALVAASAGSFWVVSQQLEHDRLRSEAALHAADARSLEAGTFQPRTWKSALEDRLRDIQRRPGTVEAIVVDRRFRVVAAGDRWLVGDLHRTPRLAAALQRGIAWSGKEGDPRHDQRNFEFFYPVDLPTGRYALEVTTDGAFLNRQLSAIRRQLILIHVAALLVVVALFWLAGGRRLLRDHGYALRRATRDGLTDLANHRAFQEELHRAGALAVRTGEPLALVKLDIDSFKFANDRYGHAYGDEQLRAVARVLSSGRAGDHAFRIGGDEFAVLLSRTDAEGAHRAAVRVHGRLAEEGLHVSLGVGELRRGQTPADLREEADAALYEAKRAGGNCVVDFDAIADSVSVVTTAQARALDDLIADGGVDIAFQPIWDLGQATLLGVEALARPRPWYGFDGPAGVFDAAQQLGRMHELDALCVTRILERASELPPDVLLFVNVCPQTLDADAHTGPWLANAVMEARLDPARIVIEVTERAGARTKAVVEGLRDLRSRGFRIAIDDLGTGNSGLEMLRETGADYIKLDRSVVVGALTDPRARGVLLAVAAFASQTGAFVVAEGIEDEQVLDLVLNLGSDLDRVVVGGGQGFGLGRPDVRLPRPTSIAPPPLLRSALIERQRASSGVLS